MANFGQLSFWPFWPLVSATGNTSYANLSANTNLTSQLRSRNPPLVLGWVTVGRWLNHLYM